MGDRSSHARECHGMWWSLLDRTIFALPPSRRDPRIGRHAGSFAHPPCEQALRIPRSLVAQRTPETLNTLKGVGLLMAGLWLQIPNDSLANTPGRRLWTIAQRRSTPAPRCHVPSWRANSSTAGTSRSEPSHGHALRFDLGSFQPQPWTGPTFDLRGRAGSAVIVALEPDALRRDSHFAVYSLVAAHEA